MLFDTAARFAKAGVEIGAEVTGYTLNSTASYTTSGKENSYDMEASDGTETTTAQPATITRDSGVKCTYIGTDKEGNALIAGSVTADSPKITLGGKGGYANGPAVLDAACEAMYSSSKGTARSMKIDDVTRVLEYTGEEGVNWDTNGNEVKLREAKTINQIAKEIGYDMTGFQSSVPEAGKPIGSYKSDYYYINKTSDASEYNTARADIIYPATANTKLTTAYWLSSPCVDAYFYYGCAYFGVRYVSSGGVRAYYVFGSGGYSIYYEYALRPVVSLSSDIQVTYNGTTAAIN